MNDILNKKIKYYIRQLRKISIIMIIGMFLILSIIFIKYKPIYQVKLEGDQVGYIQDKERFAQSVEELMEKKEENIISISLEEEPEYELTFVSKMQSTNEEAILAKVKDFITTTYVRYAITLDGENKGYAKTQEEAEQMVEAIKTEFDDKLELNLAVIKEYTENEEDVNAIDVELAKNQMDDELSKIVAQEEKKKQSSVNGVLLASKPVTGMVSSRFGATNGRDHSHKGIDIAAQTGTPIYACGDGTVTRAGWASGYGRSLRFKEVDNILEHESFNTDYIYISTPEELNIYGENLLDDLENFITSLNNDYGLEKKLKL